MRALLIALVAATVAHSGIAFAADSQPTPPVPTPVVVITIPVAAPDGPALDPQIVGDERPEVVLDGAS